MTRFYNEPGSKSLPKINASSVSDFFDDRAKKINTIGPLCAVIYQEKNPDLAEKRNIAEKRKLLPMLRLDGSQRVLDVGCGTGRWAYDLLPLCNWYHGIDACDGLVDYSKSKFKTAINGKFSTSNISDFSLKSLNEKLPFNKILCAGVLIYLNDAELKTALKCMSEVLAPGGSILFREPVGIKQRLTISEQYSDDLDQIYNAIYRTRSELITAFFDVLSRDEYALLGSGDVFDDTSLNNRTETKQQWFLLGRK